MGMGTGMGLILELNGLWVCQTRMMGKDGPGALLTVEWAAHWWLSIQIWESLWEVANCYQQYKRRYIKQWNIGTI